MNRSIAFRTAAIVGSVMAAVVMQCAFAAAAPGDDTNAVPDAGAKNAEREQSLKQMREMAGGIEVKRGREEEKVVAGLLTEAILRYSDPPRHILDATLWCFGTTGRPAAFCKIEKYPDESGGNRWLYCFASLSTSLVEARWRDDKEFIATKPGIAFIDLKEAPPPAATKSARLRQMKDLVRRISISIADPDQGFKENLRLLARPVHLYDDTGTGILDGAAFVFSTNGTNPDAIILIEAQETAKGKSQWKFAPARMTTGELNVGDGESEVWTVPFSPFVPNIGRNLDTWIYFYAKPQDTTP